MVEQGLVQTSGRSTASAIRGCHSLGAGTASYIRFVHVLPQHQSPVPKVLLYHDSNKLLGVEPVLPAVVWPHRNATAYKSPLPSLRIREDRVWDVCQSSTSKSSLHCAATGTRNVGPAHNAGVVIVTHQAGMHHLDILPLTQPQICT